MSDPILPPLPENGEQNWYNDRNNFDLAIKARLEGDLAPSALSSMIGEVGADRFVTNASWADAVVSSLGMLAPPVNTPTVTFGASGTSDIPGAVEYRPVVCGTGSRVTGWDGQSDTRFKFHRGVYETNNGGSADLALYGSNKPGGAAQAATWPIIFEFNTSSTVSQVELYVWGSPTISFKVEVDGFPSVGDFGLDGPSGLGSAKRALLTFALPKARRIRFYLAGGMGLHSVRVTSGGSITKPTDTPRRGAWIGDSYVNGAGGVNSFPAGAGMFDTFAPRVLKALGCNDLILAGIGGTGFVAGMDGATPNPYSTRVAAVMAMNPHVLAINGSINDGGGGAGVQAAAEALLISTAAVPERYVIGTMKEGYAANHAAVKAAAGAQNVPFIDMLDFLHGTGNATAPGGQGNYGTLLLPDNAHPTYAGHQAISRAVFRQIATLK